MIHPYNLLTAHPQIDGQTPNNTTGASRRALFDEGGLLLTHVQERKTDLDVVALTCNPTTWWVEEPGSL